jgi:hypothetical protein
MSGIVSQLPPVQYRASFLAAVDLAEEQLAAEVEARHKQELEQVKRAHEEQVTKLQRLNLKAARMGLPPPTVMFLR